MKDRTAFILTSLIDRRPTIKVYPGNVEDSVLEAGVLTEIKKYTHITGLTIDAGPKTSSISADDFVIDITPGAIDDIETLTHLESLSIGYVDLTRARGLKFLRS